MMCARIGMVTGRGFRFSNTGCHKLPSRGKANSTTGTSAAVTRKLFINGERKDGLQCFLSLWDLMLQELTSHATTILLATGGSDVLSTIRE